MAVRVLGDHPLARDPGGELKSRIGTLFVRPRVLVTQPGIHATQRLAYIDDLNQQKRAAGLPPLTHEQETEEWSRSVDLIMEDDSVLIRPDPDAMGLAFEADEVLHEIVSKRQIKFVHATDERVRQAIRQRGEYWRISPLPQTPEDIVRMIRESKINIGGRPLYYYNKPIGTRMLTVHEFAKLEALDDAELGAHLQEIALHSGRRNRLFRPEVDFFGVTGPFGHKDFAERAYLPPGDGLRQSYAALRAKFEAAVPPALRQDDVDNLEWRNRMFSALIQTGAGTISEEPFRGVSPEFFLQITWVPGGRIEGGELIFDSVFDEFDRRPGDTALQKLCDKRARGFIINFVREFGDLEYVNVGRVAGSMCRRTEFSGAHRVYITEIKLHNVSRPIVRILRMQKWGIREHLEEGKDLLTSIMQAEEYTDYVLDRRLGCKQLGMALTKTIGTGRIDDTYDGSRAEYRGKPIWATYFDRDYIVGVATDKIPRAKYQDERYALRLAALLGRAAAPNMIVGRLSQDEKVVFDDGDEIVVEDAAGLPQEIIAADHSGTFTDYTGNLSRYAKEYAAPVNRREKLAPNVTAFANAYIEGFAARFRFIQQEYRRRRRAFDTLFKHRVRDPAGNFAYRWEKVLERLDTTDVLALAEEIERYFFLA